MTSPADDVGTAARVLHNASPRSFARNVVFGYLATLTSLLSGVFVTPVLFRNLGVDAFAVFGLTTGITGLALLADLGVGTSAVRRIAAAVADGNSRALWTTVRASRLLLIGSALLSMAALSAVAWSMPSLFSLPHAVRHDAQVSLLVLAIGQSIAIGLGTPTAVIVGHGRSDLLAKRATVLGALTAVGECLVAAVGGGVVGVCVVVAVSSVLTALIGQLLQRRVVDLAAPDGERADGEVRDILREGAANFVISIAGTVAFMSDTIVLGAIAPLAAIAAYTIAAKLPALIRIFSSKAIDLLQPTYSHLHSVRQDKPDQTLFTALAQSTKFSVAAAVALGLGVCCSSRFLLDAWVGHTPPKAETVLILLMVATILQMSGHAVYVLLTGIRRLRRLLYFSLVNASVNIGLSIWLTNDLGAPGPALASLVCVAVGDVIVLPLLAAPAMGVAPLRLLRELTLIPVVPVVAPAFLAWAIGVPTRSAWALAVSAGAVVLYAVLFWFVVGRSDRDFARRMLQRMLGRPVSAAA